MLNENKKALCIPETIQDQEDALAKLINYSEFCELVEMEKDSEFIVLNVRLIEGASDTAIIKKRMENLSIYIKNNIRCDDVYTQSDFDTYRLLCYGFDEHMIVSITKRFKKGYREDLLAIRIEHCHVHRSRFCV